MPVVVRELRQHEFEVTITEVGVGLTDEVIVNGVPVVGTIRRVQCQSDGAIVAPILGRAVDPENGSITDIVVEPVALADATLPEVDRCGGAVYSCAIGDGAGRGRLFHRSRSIGDITTVYRITAGW